MVDRRMAYEAYRKRTEIPRGLDYLAERLVRAVIRVQPKNIHEFAAQFFDGLLQQRDHCEYLCYNDKPSISCTLTCLFVDDYVIQCANKDEMIKFVRII
ncbi:hypothetical protein QTP88_020191 [Uroleucon formosanum]